MSARKIIYIIAHMDWFWSHRLPLALGAQAQGWDVYVAAPGATHDPRLAQYGFIAIEMPDAFSHFSPVKSAAFFAKLFWLQLSVRPAIIHAITLKCALFAGLVSRFSPSIKPLHTIAGLGYLFSDDGWKPKFLRKILMPFLKFGFSHKRAEIIFQNSDDMNRFITAGLATQDNAYLIPGSGVDVEEFRYNEEPESDVPLVVMPTRLLHDKGVGVFIEAARILKARGIQARFAIAGGLWQGNPHAITDTEMRGMIADGAVEWLGKVHDMPKLLAACTLVVYPSWYREGVPKVLLESAAAGRAIVTTDHPGCRDAVAHGVNGLLAPVKNASATADAIEFLLKDTTTRKAMGLAGRQRAQNEFNVVRIVEETLQLY